MLGGKKQVTKNKDEVKAIPVEKPTPDENTTAVESTEPPRVPAEQPRRKRHLGLFALLLLVLAALAVAAGYLLKELQTENDTKSAQPSSVAEKPHTPQSTDITGLLTNISQDLSGGAVTHDRAAPDYTVSGYDFAARGDKEKSSGIAIEVPKETIDVTMTKAENALTAKKFSKSAKQPTEPINGLVKYENTDTICGVSNNESEATANNRNSVYVDCALKNTYTETAKTQKPFYDALRASKSDDQSRSVGYPRISDSRTRGYKTAEASIYNEAQGGGAMGLFYMVPGATKWEFFRSTQEIVPCSDYNTNDLKRAYYGERCFDIGTNSDTMTVGM